ncbi:Clp protease ClpP [Lachnospiraceae bacterium MD335]|nr:Clp protease ClpP [Lachnospiraceae bacterium MD335]
MPKVLKLQKKDRNNRYREVGSIEIRNETETAADLCFFGDINSESLGEWQKYYPEDKAPKDVQDFLDQLNGVSRINVHINSGGGSVFGGIAIYNILKRHNAEITVYVEGLAASIASVIAMAGDRIIIPENAQMMIHKPSSITWGNADDMRKEADILDGCQKVILNTYMQHTKEGVTPEQINALIDAETWKNGKEWQEFFDVEVSEKNSAAACASDYFDQYNNLPEKLRENPEPQAVNIDSLVDAIAEATAQRIKEALQEKQAPEADGNKEKQIAAILEDLDLI